MNQIPESVAYHEAGHAVACLITGFKFRYVTIIANEEENSLGHVMLSKLRFNPDSDISDRVRLKVEKYITICLAGPIAEQKFTGSSNDIGATKDYEMSFARASNLFGPTKLINAFMNYMRINTETIFTFLLEEGSSDTDAWEDVKVLAHALVKSKKLRYKQVLKILPQYS